MTSGRGTGSVFFFGFCSSLRRDFVLCLKGFPHYSWFFPASGESDLPNGGGVPQNHDSGGSKITVLPRPSSVNTNAVCVFPSGVLRS